MSKDKPEKKRKEPRIQAAPAPPGEDKSGTLDDPERRKFLTKFGTAAICAALGIPVILSMRSCVPNVLYEEPRRFKVGEAVTFTDGPSFIADKRVFIFKEKNTFHCISAVCTHLGCTVQLVRLKTSVGGGAGDFEFHCPCHGSKYHADGVNYAGPAPKPLSYFKLELAPDDGQLIVDMSKAADRGWRLTV